MTKTKSVFPLGAKGRGTEMAKFMAEFQCRADHGLSSQIELLRYCEEFFLRGVTVKKIRKLAAARDMQIKAMSGRNADGRHFWRVILQLSRGRRVLCFFSYRQWHDTWGRFDTIIQDYKLLNVVPVEMKRVTRRQRDRELDRLNAGAHPFITLP